MIKKIKQLISKKLFTMFVGQAIGLFCFVSDMNSAMPKVAGALKSSQEDAAVGSKGDESTRTFFKKFLKATAEKKAEEDQEKESPAVGKGEAFAQTQSQERTGFLGLVKLLKEKEEARKARIEQQKKEEKERLAREYKEAFEKKREKKRIQRENFKKEYKEILVREISVIRLINKSLGPIKDSEGNIISDGVLRIDEEDYSRIDSVLDKQDGLDKEIEEMEREYRNELKELVGALNISFDDADDLITKFEAVGNDHKVVKVLEVAGDNENKISKAKTKREEFEKKVNEKLQEKNIVGKDGKKVDYNTVLRIRQEKRNAIEKHEMFERQDKAIIEQLNARAAAILKKDREDAEVVVSSSDKTGDIEEQFSPVFVRGKVYRSLGDVAGEVARIREEMREAEEKLAISKKIQETMVPGNLAGEVKALELEREALAELEELKRSLSSFEQAVKKQQETPYTPEQISAFVKEKEAAEKEKKKVEKEKKKQKILKQYFIDRSKLIKGLELDDYRRASFDSKAIEELKKIDPELNVDDDYLEDQYKKYQKYLEKKALRATI